VLRRRGRGHGAPADAGFAAAVVDQLDDGVIACDAAGRVVLASRRAREQHGGRIKALPTDGWADGSHVSYPGQSRALTPEELPLARALRGEDLQGLELCVARPGAVPRTLLVDGGPVTDRQGRRVGAAIRLRDVTAERADMAASALRSTVFDGLPAGVVLVRAADGVMVFVNEAWDQMFGYARGELVGRHVSVVNAADEQSPYARAEEILGALERDGTWRGEMHHVRKDGTRFWCAADIVRFEHPVHGTVWLSAHVDISVSKAAALSVLQSEERFRGAFEAAPAAIAILGRDLRVVEVNAELSAITGRARERLVGATLADLTHHDDRAHEARLLNELAGGEIPHVRAEVRLVAVDGAAVPVALSATVVRGPSGGWRYAVAVIEDLDARREPARAPTL
jgi:PAS domain S-box-containing protein